MNLPLISIGNSKGIRIPKTILDQCSVESEFQVEIVDENIVLKPVRTPKNFKFDDLKSLSDLDIQKLLKRLDITTLSIALIGTDDEIKSKIFNNLSKKAFGIISDEIKRLESLDSKALIIEMQRSKINQTLISLM